MKTTVLAVSGLGWIPLAAFIAWWMGFTPFPTRPESIYSTREVFDGPGSINKDPAYPLLLSPPAAKTKVGELKYGFNSWSCEDPPNKDHCTIVERRESPFFGWGSPHWVVVSYGSLGGVALRLYRSYSACAWMAERMTDKRTTEEVQYERWAIEHGQKVESSYTSYSCEELPR